LSVLSFASVLNSFSWFFDVLTHFNLQFALGLMACFVLGFLLRLKRWHKFITALALLVNIYFLYPYFLPRATITTGSSSLMVMALNVFTDNQDYTSIVGYLRETSADVVLLSEVEPSLMTAIKTSLSDLYPHLYDESMEGTHGLAFISRLPFTTQTVTLDERHHRFLTAELEWQGETIKLYGAHPHPPIAGRWARSRNEEIAVIREVIRQETRPHLFLGDLNASPWSQPMRDLFAQTNLRHAALGFGIYPTWRYKTILLGAPLDHILVSPEWLVSSYTVDRDVGSDHFPMIATLHLP
jgi:endonuclease/exonuclease/phosphatase (EEP) superfamily protein YafD